MPGGDRSVKIWALLEVSIRWWYNDGIPKLWMVCSGKSLWKWMICGYLYFRKHPYGYDGDVPPIWIHHLHVTETCWSPVYLSLVQQIKPPSFRASLAVEFQRKHFNSPSAELPEGPNEGTGTGSKAGDRKSVALRWKGSTFGVSTSPEKIWHWGKK